MLLQALWSSFVIFPGGIESMAITEVFGGVWEYVCVYIPVLLVTFFQFFLFQSSGLVKHSYLTPYVVRIHFKTMSKSVGNLWKLPKMACKRLPTS